MARMHSKSKGVSGSNTLIEKKTPAWVKYKPEEIESLVVKLAKEGNSSSKIGLILRDSYGIPDVPRICNKSITEIMVKGGIEMKIPEDMLNLIKKAIAIRKHIDLNGQDKTAKRGLQLTESKIRRLVKFYKSNKVLPENWKYDPANVRIYIG